MRVHIIGKKYTLTARPLRSQQDEYGNNVFSRVRFTASDGINAAHVMNYDLSKHPVDGLIIGLFSDDIERGIRINQALKRGEVVDLGRFDAEHLAEIGFTNLTGGSANALTILNLVLGRCTTTRPLSR